MTSRYENKKIVKNQSDLYASLFKEREVYFIRQYRTGKLNFPTPRQNATIDAAPYIWKIGDKYWKLAEKHYGDPRAWWILAWYNRKPTEAHVRAGQIVLIPSPLSTLLSIFMGTAA